MKKLRICAAFAMLLAASAMYATQSITLSLGSGQTIKVDVPDEVATVVIQNQKQIENAMNQYNVTHEQADNALSKVNEFYKKLGDYGIKTTTPYTTATKGLNDFSDTLLDVIPNSQTQQNVWSEAWIGKLPHFGFGLNAGAAKLDISSLKNASEALGINVSGMRDNYALPTVTADVRIGGFLLPFDLGFTISSLDSSKIGSLDSAIDPAAFNFFTVGGDIRYALLRGRGIFPKLSVGGGFYYTDGGVSVSDSTAKASMDFKSTTLFLSTQASVKLLCLVPFVGGRLMITKTNVDWDANADWSKIYTGSGSEYLANAQQWGILPTSFSGGSSSSYFDNVRPQLYGGLSVDLLVIDITTSVSYDFLASIPSAAVSLRLSL